MGNIIFTVFIVILYIYAFFYLFSVILKNSAQKKLNDALVRRDEKLFAERSKKLGARLLGKSGIEDIKLNYYMTNFNHVGIESTIKEINSMKLSKREIKSLYPVIFYYYVQRNKIDDAKKYYEPLKDLKYSNKKLVDGIYNAFIDGKADLLEQTTKLLKKASKEDLPIIESVISKMYENLNDNPNAKRYRRLSEKHQKELDIKKR